MTPEHPLRQIVSELDLAGIRHMLTGSFASTYHGDPRTTNDIDLVISCERAALDRWATTGVAFVDAWLTTVAIRRRLPVCSPNAAHFADVRNTFASG